ncbi:hypothetical protein BIW11_09017 [Tropilaelaps mercedesae]|uniref:Spaetzle domain-containing protein n=1 Tax=Tropilaelaps mercedesae TaxID=418985 RepID=A0A1V9XM74_9ACAR|nr:hypothetical protein BIW11_09017 [Tropilaelaps mercedesae]
MNLFENLRKFLAAVLSVVSRATPHDGHNVTSLAHGASILVRNSTVEDNLVQVESLIKPSGDLNGCCPLYPEEKHPLPDEVQLRVLNHNFNHLRMFYQKRRDTALLNSAISRTQEHSDEQQNYVPLCDSVRTVQTPTSAKDVHGVKHFLLNPAIGEYHQYIENEYCKNYDAPCPFLDSTLPGQRSLCRTHYFKKGLTAINETTLLPYEIVVRVAAGCNCFVQTSLLPDLAKARP